MIILLTGNMGSLEMYNYIKQKTEKSILIGETNTLPYGCRLRGDGEVNIGILAPKISIAAFPSLKNEQIVNEAGNLFDRITESENILEVALNNPNPLIHPTGVLLNIGQIERTGEFALYNEGITPSTLNIIYKKQEEKECLAKMFDLKIMAYEDFKGILLNGKEESFVESGRLGGIKGPNEITNRYLTEDIPFGLVLWSTIAESVGIFTPTINAEIAITSAIHQTNHMKEGRTAKSLGLEGLCNTEIKELLQIGKINIQRLSSGWKF